MGGFEPPIFRLTAERENLLRHRDNNGSQGVYIQTAKSPWPVIVLSARSFRANYLQLGDLKGYTCLSVPVSTPF